MSRSKNRRRAIAAAGLASAACAGAAAPGAAHAQQSPQPYGQASVFVGYTWGESGGFTWGLEGRAGMDLRDPFGCSVQPTLVAGGVARVSFVELRPQLHIGPQAGVGFGPMSVMGDVTLGYRWGDDENVGGFSVPIGLELEVWAFQTFFRGDPMLADIAIGGGGGYAPREISMSCAVVGRALHDELGQAPLPSIERLDHDRAACAISRARELEAAASDEWAARAASEWASVPAFLQLADQLAAARAPASLARRAILAAYDEMRHAELAARAAVHLSAEHAPLRIGRVTPHTRARRSGGDALVRLAVESWADGCLGEGRAARVAQGEAAASATHAPRSLQAMIARDEQSHADLAWDVLDWALDAGGEQVREALIAARDASPGEGSGAPDELDLSAHGLASRAHHARVGAEVAEEARRSLDRRLHARPRA